MLSEKGVGGGSGQCQHLYRECVCLKVCLLLRKKMTVLNKGNMESILCISSTIFITLYYNYLFNVCMRPP